MTIAVVSGPVHSGKTTRLRRWCRSRGGADGLLAPIETGGRALVRIRSGKMRTLETREPDALTVGPYRFSRSVFAWGRAELVDAARGTALTHLIIDEYGKLELRGEGLEPAVGEALSVIRASSSAVTVVIVIREGLVQPALSRLGINASEVTWLDPQ